MSATTQWIDLGETGKELAFLFFIAVIEDNDWKALELLNSFRDSDPAVHAAMLAEAKITYMTERPLALPSPSGAKRTRSNRRGKSLVAIKAPIVRSKAWNLYTQRQIAGAICERRAA
jgi:hypothetical protein